MHLLRSALAAAALTFTLACDGLPEPPPRTGDSMPEFSAEMRGGGEFALADLHGQPALVNLWATWCPPCRSETPYIQELADELGPHGLQVLGISLDTPGARQAVDDFLTSVDATYPQLLDQRMETMDLFGVIGLPATFLVDAEGTITFFDLGPIDDGDPAFANALRALLPEGVEIPQPSEGEE